MNPFYIYALKDPRQSPAKPFYIGKGTGDRAWSHIMMADDTPKGRRITEIHNSGLAIIITKMADDLTEEQALRLEAELISAFGTEDSGGLLTNVVIPLGTYSKRQEIIVPLGIVEKAQIGLKLLSDAVLELLKSNMGGLRNADVAKALGLQSHYNGGSKDYLSWSILGLLIRDGKVARTCDRRHKIMIR